MWGIIIDVILIAIIVISAIIGIVKGFVDSVLGLIGTGLALAVAVFTAKYLSNTLNNLLKIEDWVLGKLDKSGETVKLFGGKIEYANEEVAKFAVWVITVIVIFLIIKLALLILSKLFESVVKNSPTISGINRVLGMIFGALKGGLTVVILLGLSSMLAQVPVIGSTITEKIDDTKITNTVYKYVDDFVETQLTKEKIDGIISKIVTENTPAETPAESE